MSDMLNISYPAPSHEYKALVRCFTYNQGKYIADALHGFVIQQTNFPYVCLVMDDASTDGEQSIIKEWMEYNCDMSRVETIDLDTSVVFIVPHKTNLNCTFAFYLLKKNLHGTDTKDMYVEPWRNNCKYEAICEGDDYWVYEHKLQQQIDLLDSEPEYGLCYTNGYIRKGAHITESLISEHPSGDIFFHLLKNNFILTCSVVIRTDIYNSCRKLITSYKKNWLMGDYPLWLELSRSSKVAYFDKRTCVYRILDESASHSIDISKIDRFNRSAMDIQLFYADKGGILDIKSYIITQFYVKMYQFCLNNGIDDAPYRSYIANLQAFYSRKVFYFHLFAKYKVMRALYRIYYNLTH